MDTLCQQIENDEAAKGEKNQRTVSTFREKSCKQKKNLCFMSVYMCMCVCVFTHAHVKEEKRVAF